MGLDMYFFDRRGEDGTELKYFRKHSHLHGFITDWLHDKPASNCEYLVVTRENLIQIREMSQAVVDYFKQKGIDAKDEDAWKHEITGEIIDEIIESGKETFPIAEGFFWGTSCLNHYQETVEFIDELLEDEDLELVYYYSWW